VNTKREKLLSIIEALLQKTVSNGCTEAEALLAAEKVQEIMERHGLSLADLEATDQVSACEEAGIKVSEKYKQRHPIADIAYEIASFTSTKFWHQECRDGHHITFFGLPEDVRIAFYLAKLIREAMNLEWRFYWAVNCGRTDVSPNIARKSFMKGMSHRIGSRLYDMEQTREHRHNDCKAIVLKKEEILAQAIKALGIKFTKGRSPNYFEADDTAYGAGDVAGARTQLNAGNLK